MTASGGLYPSLGKHFKNMTELAHAGNMNRDTMRKCLNGERQFTSAEKKCISANIAMKLINSPSYDYVIDPQLIISCIKKILPYRLVVIRAAICSE